MVVLLCMLALGMVATGVAAVLFGAPIVQVERGWTMVIAGSAWGAGGAVLLGVALAVHRLGRVAHSLTDIRDRVASLGEMTAEQVAGEAPFRKPAPAADPGLAPAAFVPPLTAEAGPEESDGSGERVVVGQYASGGNSYTMFSDGSIEAETPAGHRRFASLQELRAFASADGEQPA